LKQTTLGKDAADPRVGRHGVSLRLASFLKAFGSAEKRKKRPRNGKRHRHFVVSSAQVAPVTHRMKGEAEGLHEYYEKQPSGAARLSADSHAYLTLGAGL
jgi:hypothetical protein